jgi:multidrug efflux system membrane fusion protein
VRDKFLKAHVWLPLAAICCVGCSKEQPYQKPITPVRVQAVGTEAPEDGPKYSGSIEPASQVNLAFRLGGYVSQIMTVPDGGGTRLLQESDVVPKGATLVRLRQDDYKVKVAEAQSQVNQAQAGLDKAKLDYDRADDLFKKQSLTKPDMDGARAQLENAQALFEGANAQLADANLALKDSVLTSPSEGVVIKRLVEVGSLVGPGTPAFVLADLNSLKAVFGAPDVLLPQLTIGMPLTLSTEAFPRSFTGRITSIAAAADPRSRVFEVEVSFPNPGLRLKPGMIVTIELANRQSAAGIPVVPMGSIVRSKTNSDGYSVFVVDDEGGKSVCHSRDITLGSARGCIPARR